LSVERRVEIMISPEIGGIRLDQALARMFSDHSRTALKSLILDGRVRVNGRPARPSDKVASGDRIEVEFADRPVVDFEPQPLPLDIVYQDDDIIVINKPPGLVVHPGAGNRARTLLNALLHFDSGLGRLPRAGIVHRLDKDTSGLLVVARSDRAHTRLVAALGRREVIRVYQALVHGVPVAGGRVDAAIGRHPRQRTRMAVVDGGRPAITHFRLLARFRVHALLEVRLESGRTHQIRVHMAHLGHPLVGDPTYGGRPRIPAAAAEDLIRLIREFRRQALHAERLDFEHPGSGERMSFRAPLPGDLRALLDALERDARSPRIAGGGGSQRSPGTPS
jgi:23S rRNA pseudouridine1911/1915/1917 synthase